MACSVLSVSRCLTSLAVAPRASSTTSTNRRSCINDLSSSSSLFDGKMTAASLKICRIKRINRRSDVTRASAAEGPADVEGGAPPGTGETETNPLASLKLQSDLLKKKAKKLELRRKRLVRKRHLRKKGRWPPSKMKKNKNV